MAEKSNLPQVGCLLMIIGAVLPVAIAKYVTLSGGMAIAVDLLRVLFFIGLVLLIIGWLRNRRVRGTNAP
jgi:hypothetical protein